MNALSVFEVKFRTEQLKICETQYWVWSLRPQQATLGAGVLSLKRECPKFGQLKPEEFCDLHEIVRVLEDTLSRSFSYEAINYLMMMMVDKQVHFHVFPRYSSPIELFGKTWVDRYWPGVPSLQDHLLPEQELSGIVSYIKSNLPF